jgi:hypothetical protein
MHFVALRVSTRIVTIRTLSLSSRSGLPMQIGVLCVQNLRRTTRVWLLKSPVIMEALRSPARERRESDDPYVIPELTLRATVENPVM